MPSSTTANFPTSSFTTPRNLTYQYIHIPPSSPINSSILILHGFPSIPTDFTHQITHLSQLGHGIIAPYLLGYHPSSTPRDPSAYRLKLICDDLISILDHLDLSTTPVHAVGHDWGATLLSRLEYYYPDRVLKLAYLTIAPVPFGQEFDLDAVNALTKEHLGYEGFGYQKLLVEGYESGRAAELLGEKHERMEMLMFAEDAGVMWREYFGKLGGLERWLDGKQEAELFDGVDAVDVDRRRNTFSSETSGGVGTDDGDSGVGYAGAIMWYVSHIRNLNVEDERAGREDWSTYKTKKDVLLVLCEKDPISIPAMHEQMANAYVDVASSQLQIVHLHSGHFLMFEQASKVNDSLERFFA